MHLLHILSSITRFRSESPLAGMLNKALRLICCLQLVEYSLGAPCRYAVHQKGVLPKSYLPAPASKCLCRCLVFFACMISWTWISYLKCWVPQGVLGVIVWVCKLQGFCSISLFISTCWRISTLTAVLFSCSHQVTTPSEGITIFCLHLLVSSKRKQLWLSNVCLVPHSNLLNVWYLTVTLQNFSYDGT